MIRGATFSSPDATISANTLQNTPHCDHSALRPASSVGRCDLSGGYNDTNNAGAPNPPPAGIVGGDGGNDTIHNNGIWCGPPRRSRSPRKPLPPNPRQQRQAK